MPAGFGRLWAVNSSPSLRVCGNCIATLNWHLIRTAFLMSGDYMRASNANP